MSGLSAKKLRLHPAPDLEPTENRFPERSGSDQVKTILIILVIGISAGLLAKGYCHFMRYYQAEGRITIQGTNKENLPSAIRKHLSGLQTFDLTFSPGSDPEEKISIPELMRTGRLSVFPSDSQTISLLVTDSDDQAARSLSEEIASSYVSYVTGSQNARSTKMTGKREKLFADYKQLQQEHEKLKLNLSKLAHDLPQDKLDDVLVSTSKQIQGRIQEAEGLIKQLDKTNQAISVLRKELIHPTLKLDPERWDQTKKSDRLYSGDFTVLKNKHGEYMNLLQGDIRGMSQSLDQMRGLLRTLSESINKQIQMQLPEDLSDDLLEMNLAVEKYDGQLSHFQDRWERYQAKIVELLSDPTAADFSGVTTLLSQLRQDLMNRCSRLPEQIGGLFNQLRQGSPGSPGNLSSLTPRQVASSNISKEIEQLLDAWRKVSFHLNRLFADPKGNVNLLTLGRICRSLQWRLTFREKQLRQIIEQSMITSQRREVQNQLVERQKEFEVTSGKLIALYRKFSEDQAQLAQISTRWPESQKIQETIRKVEQQMAGLEKELDHTSTMLGPEQLEVQPSIVRAYSHTGINMRWEMTFILLFVAVGLGAGTWFIRPDVVEMIVRKVKNFRHDPTV